MKTKVILVGFLAVASLAMGQKKPPSPKETEAWNAVVAAQTPDARIAAVENLVTKFKDSDLKSIALGAAAAAAQQKGDVPGAIVYGNRAIEADPKNFQAMLLVSGLLAQGTREFDLDKDEKVKRATKLANDAITTVAAAPKPNPQITDDQWAGAKKDATATAHETLGIIASVDKKWDVAVTEFKTAVEGGSTPEPTTMLRLAATYNNAKQYDQATAMADQVLAMPSLPENFKKIAQEEKQRAAKAKGSQK